MQPLPLPLPSPLYEVARYLHICPALTLPLDLPRDMPLGSRNPAAPYGIMTYLCANMHKIDML